MNNYDFKTLSDKEFEVLACDLLSEHEKRRFERFKPGKDQGVDGRFFINNDEIILQSKHYANLNQLLGVLEAKERPKVEALKPSRYMLAVSNPLSRRDKQKIAKIFYPYLHESDIFGAEDLNDFLGLYPFIEKRHYKLWLHSSEVITTILNHGILGRSVSSLDDIQESASRYVITENHVKALSHLKKTRVLIISGEPGIGKTTLAGHLCIEAVCDGYEFIEIADDLKEAELVFRDDRKQIFYFDDFLGRNYLEALAGHEGKKITKFIKRVSKDPKKLFVLTSRSTILNQGKILIDLYEHEKLNKNEYELKIKSLSRMDKARILYNHLYHSDLLEGYRDQIFLGKKYIDIIDHRNFNPRLISYLTDAARLNGIRSNDYLRFIDSSLKNPRAIWDHPFVAQQDDYGRAMTLLVVLHRHSISEKILSIVYQSFISAPINQNMKGRRDFIDTLRSLTGSLLNRSVNPDGDVVIDLFNPSIGDYVLKRYSNDLGTLMLAFNHISIPDCLMTIKGMYRSKITSHEVSKELVGGMLTRVNMEGFNSIGFILLTELLAFSISLEINEKKTLTIMKNAANFVFTNAARKNLLDDSFKVIKWALQKGFCKPESALGFVENLHTGLHTELEIAACFALLKDINDNTPMKYNIVHQVNDSVCEVFADNLSEFVDLDYIFSECNLGDYLHARNLIAEEIQERLGELGAVTIEFDSSKIADDSNYKAQMDEYFHEKEISDFPSSSIVSNGDDNSEESIHDLFSRD